MSALFGTLWSMPGGGAATTDGLGIDQSSAITGATLIFDLQGISRPVAANIVVGTGDLIDMATSADPDALLDGNHPSWVEVRAASGFSVIEMVTAAGVAGVRIRRTSGSSSGSSVRVYAPQRGPGYNPVYDPNYDVAFAGVNDARRFMDQATMGPVFGEPQSLAASPDTIGDWMDAQRLLTPGSIKDTFPSTATVNTENLAYTYAAHGMVQRMCVDAAQLKFRMGWAIGQIIVAGASNGSRDPNMISWWDRIIAGSLGNYADLLKLSWMHRHMGMFLNNMNNSARNIAPSQNYGRELVQLFSIGTKMLNKNGTPVLDSEGRVVPSYTQEDVGAIARYSCGWTLSNWLDAPGAGGSPANGDMQPAGGTYGFNGHDTASGYTTPGVWPLFGKTEMDYPAFAVDASPNEAKLIARRDACIELIMLHPSTGPYVCKQLIQKLVTDAPSKEYVRRVVAAWDDNGSGVHGDLYAVARAIYMDAEARGNSKPSTFGRVPEPALTVTRRMRYANVLEDDFAADVGRGHWWHNLYSTENIIANMGQWVTQPISVFNDYPFEYEIEGAQAPAAATWGEVAFLTNFSVAMSGSNAFANTSAYPADNKYGRWLATGLIGFYDATAGSTADKNSALIDRAYADYFQGAAIPAYVKTELAGALAAFDSQSRTTRQKCCWLISMLNCVPRAAVII